MLSERQSHRTPVHHLDDLLLGVASSHRALEEGSLLVLGERIFQDWSSAPSASTSWCMGWWWWCRWFLGVLISRALRHAAFSPCPCSVTGVAIWVQRG